MSESRERLAQVRRPLAVLVGAACLACSLAHAAAPPATSAPPGHPPAAMRAASAPAKKPVPVKRVDINRASRKELLTLPGIGKDEADKIIAHRPYLVSTDIVDKAGIPAGVYVSIKRRIVAMPTAETRKAMANPAR